MSAVTSPYLIEDVPGFAPQIGRLVAMMSYARGTTLEAVEGLTAAQLDHLHDGHSNSIAALLAHIAGIEVAYQLQTFEGRDFSEAEWGEWGPAVELGEFARQEIRGRDLDDYREILASVRARTLRELASRTDDWLYARSWWGDGPANNYFLWFHVFEDELNHRGQIRWLRKRLPRV